MKFFNKLFNVNNDFAKEAKNISKNHALRFIVTVYDITHLSG